MATKKKPESHGMGLPLVAGAIAGMAGAYFLYGQGKQSASNRKKIKSWMIKAKGEALEKLEKVKSLDEESYHKIMDGIAEKYGKVKDVDPEEVKALVQDLKKHWKSMMRDMQPKKRKKSAPKAKAPVATIS
jgi:gas vesicle protein